MKRLIEKGLMFGNLVPVESPALVERYNRALKKLTGKVTALPDFHIDISGYSPEVGDELGDHHYLNPNGMNLQFILLTTDQQSAPLLQPKFSTTRGILRQFIAANEAQLFALTARDAVVGEVDNGIFALDRAEQLFDIRRVTVTADTTGAHLAEAEKLGNLIDCFRKEPDAWYDDVLIADMIGLAKKTGDVMRHPVRLKNTEVPQPNFWTAHFGGIYIFRDVKYPAAIVSQSVEPLGLLPIPQIGLANRNEIAKFLEVNELAEPIVKARDADAGAILRQKMDFILVDAAASAGIDFGTGSRRDLRAIANTLGSKLPPEFTALAALLRWVEVGGAWPRITSEHPAYFYSLRATPRSDRDLVNRLLAELSPLDVRQLFILHKDLFYRLYSGWSDAKKDFVASYLEREYQIDKAGMRRDLFGPEPGMEEAPPRTEIELVGPWGAVRKERR